MVYTTKSQFQKEFKLNFTREVSNHGQKTELQELFAHMNLVFIQNELTRVSICHYKLEFPHLVALFKCINSSHGNTIKELVLNSCQLSESMSEFIAKQLRDKDSIQSIELFGNEIENKSLAEWGKYIESSKNLARLKLGDNRISSEGIKILSNALTSNNSVVQLHLGGNSIGDQGIVYLCEVIPESNKSVVSLALRENNLTEYGMISLCKMLMHKDCNISDIQLKGNYKIGPEGAKNLAPALSVNKSLKVLELHGANIGAEGATACCHNMTNNVSIHAINFNQNDIGDMGAISVANLIQMGRISTLGLSENNISYRGVTALSHAFNYSNLTGIDLGGNCHIGNSGAIEIARALSTNCTITSIDLRGCGIGIKGCIALADMTAQNSHLQHLDLGGNSCKNDGAEAFSHALRRNVTLKRLCLTDNLIMNRGGVALAYGLQQNVTLINLAYGGQGEKQNKISSPVRNIIDSIIKENKRLAKEIESLTIENKDDWKLEVLEKSTNLNRRADVQDILNRYKEARKAGGAPHWIQSCIPSQFPEGELFSMLVYLFKSDLIPKRDPKYPNYVYLSDLATCLVEYFPETSGKISNMQLLQFMFRKQQFYVHLPSNAGPQYSTNAQIKFLNDSPKRSSPVNAPQTPERSEVKCDPSIEIENVPIQSHHDSNRPQISQASSLSKPLYFSPGNTSIFNMNSKIADSYRSQNSICFTPNMNLINTPTTTPNQKSSPYTHNSYHSRMSIGDHGLGSGDLRYKSNYSDELGSQGFIGVNPPMMKKSQETSHQNYHGFMGVHRSPLTPLSTNTGLFLGEPQILNFDTPTKPPSEVLQFNQTKQHEQFPTSQVDFEEKENWDWGLDQKGDNEPTYNLFSPSKGTKGLQAALRNNLDR